MRYVDSILKLVKSFCWNIISIAENTNTCVYSQRSKYLYEFKIQCKGGTMAAKIVLWLLFAHYMFMKCTAKKSWRRDNKWCTMPMSLQCWFENGFKSRFLCKRFWECGVTTNDTPYRVHHWQRGHDPISFFWFWVFPSTVPYQVMKTDCRESGFENSDIVVALQGVLISRTSGCWPSRKKNLLCLCICLCLSVCLCLFSTQMVIVLGWKGTLQLFPLPANLPPIGATEGPRKATASSNQ